MSSHSPLERLASQPIMLIDPDGVTGIATRTSTKTSWMLIGICAQGAWGFYGVCCRYLQHQSGFGSFFLTFSITALSAACLLLFVELPALIFQRCRGSPSLAADDAAQMKPPPAPLGQKLRLLACIGAVYFSLTVLGVVSLNMTKAYWNQLAGQTIPIMVALIQLLVYKEPLPPYTWTAIGLVVAGAAMILIGGSGMLSPTASSEFTSLDAWGILLGLIATLLLAIFFLLVAQSSGVVGESELLWCNYALQVVLGLGLSLAFEKPDLGIFWKMSPQSWIMLLVAGVGVMFGANFTQQFVIREIGAPMFSTFMAAQVVLSVIGAWLVLNEPLSNWLEATGMVVVVASITWYLIMQLRAPKTKTVESLLSRQVSISLNGYSSVMIQDDVIPDVLPHTQPLLSSPPPS